MINLDEWYKFLQGHWTRELPTKPGLYVLAFCGLELPTVLEIVNHPTKNELIVQYIEDEPLSLWSDHWWWSEPRPMLPEAPRE